jgi:hypothetical protein
MKHRAAARLVRYLIAIVAGNAIYFAIMPHLPPRAQHQPFQIDWGLVVDFWICVVCYGIVRFIR